MNDRPRQLPLHAGGTPDASAVAPAFDPARLTQARVLAGLTKQALAMELDLSAAAVGQFEAGVTSPRRDHLSRLAEILCVPVAFFAVGRPHARLDASMAHFRSLRDTRVGQRAKAVAFVEQVWELLYALEKRVQLPTVDLPGYGDHPGDRSHLADPVTAARQLREQWHVQAGPMPHLVRTMEVHGIVVTLVPFAGEDTARVDAFSTSRLPRPLVVLTPDRANDVYRHRFTAAHELGHLLLHQDIAPGDPQQEREANLFAAELLTPGDEIAAEITTRLRLRVLEDVGRRWGVSVQALITRSRELGLITDFAARRAYQRVNQMRNVGLFLAEPITTYPGETPTLLNRAFELAEQHGLSMRGLADELAWPLSRVRELLGQADTRPALRLM
jgi:Zn-dependent peptidase ImmA (M78 family)/transcriptional regulator with XRE-family HTH domain